MDALDHVSNWITAQREEGRTTDDMDGTVFVISPNKVARITDTGEGKFDLEILMPPYVVDFTKSI